MLDGSRRALAYNRLRVVDARAGNWRPAWKWLAATRLAVVVDDAAAAYPVRIDPTFSDANWISMGGLPGADDRVYAAVVDGSGNLYIGGGFTVVGGVVANRIAKWNGSAWSALGSGMNEHCQCAGGVGHRPCMREAVSIHGGRESPAANLACQMEWERLVGLGLGDCSDGLPVVTSMRWRCRARTCMRGATSPRRAGSRPTGLPNGTGAPGRPWARGWTAVIRLSMRWRCRARTCMREAISPRRAGCAANHIAKWNGSAWSALGSGMKHMVQSMRWRCRARPVCGGRFHHGGRDRGQSTLPNGTGARGRPWARG